VESTYLESDNRWTRDDPTWRYPALYLNYFEHRYTVLEPFGDCAPWTNHICNVTARRTSMRSWLFINALTTTRGLFG
jgi:hypothetical protein